MPSFSSGYYYKAVFSSTFFPEVIVFLVNPPYNDRKRFHESMKNAKTAKVFCIKTFMIYYTVRFLLA